MTLEHKVWLVINYDGSPDLKTIYDHRRGAIVNWLHLRGVSILAHYTDEAIESLWRLHKKGAEVMEATLRGPIQ